MFAPVSSKPDLIAQEHEILAKWAERRTFAISVDAYTKELSFYRYLAGDVPIRSPKLYALVSDRIDAVSDFRIVMEDLTVHSKVFDQVDDPPGEQFARRIAHKAATLHAAYWESPATQLPWTAAMVGLRKS